MVSNHTRIKESQIHSNEGFETVRVGKSSSIGDAGFSLVEVVIGAALILLSVTGLVTTYSFYLKAGLKNIDSLKAAFLLQEGVEAATLMRDNSWNSIASLSTTTSYYLYWNGLMWTTTTTPQVIDSLFYRTLTFKDVYRRTSDKDIVSASSTDPKTVDTAARKLTVRVTAQNLDTQIVTYLMNLFE